MRTKKMRRWLVVAMVFAGFMLVFSGMGWGGSLEPSEPPSSTMKTLDEIPPTWSQALPVEQRFVLVLGGEAILDKETGLVWQQSPLKDPVTWTMAVAWCLTCKTGNRMGWRLPTMVEMFSLFDPTETNPALPSGHPFSNVQYTNYPEDFYWSISNDPAFGEGAAQMIAFDSAGHRAGAAKFVEVYSLYWCVRGGHGLDPSYPPSP